MPLAAPFLFFTVKLDYLIYELAEIGVKSPRTMQNAKEYINRAIRALAERQNWTGLHNRTQNTILSGQTSCSLGENFKELTDEQSPISFTYGQYNLPVVVTSRERIESFGIWPFPNGPLSFPVPGGYNPIQIVFLEQDGPSGMWTLNVPPQYPITQNAVFNVSAYYFPPPLVQGNEENWFTRHGDLVNAVINLAKSYAYAAEEVDSPKAQAAMALSRENYIMALYTDTQKRFTNRGTLRM